MHPEHGTVCQELASLANSQREPCVRHLHSCKIRSKGRKEKSCLIHHGWERGTVALCKLGEKLKSSREP